MKVTIDVNATITPTDRCPNMYKIEMTATNAVGMDAEIFISKYIPSMYPGSRPTLTFDHTIYAVELEDFATEPEDVMVGCFLKGNTATLCVEGEEYARECWESIKRDVKRLTDELNALEKLYQLYLLYGKSLDLLPETVLYGAWTKEITEDSILMGDWTKSGRRIPNAIPESGWTSEISRAVIYEKYKQSFADDSALREFWSEFDRVFSPIQIEIRV